MPEDYFQNLKNTLPFPFPSDMRKIIADPNAGALDVGMARLANALNPVALGQDFGNWAAEKTNNFDINQHPLLKRAQLVMQNAPQRELQQIGQQEQDAQQQMIMTADQQQAAGQEFSGSLAQGLMGDVEGDQSQNMGPVAPYEVPSIPLPTADMKPDYTNIRNLVEQMRPEQLDTTELDNTRGMALLAGIAAGLMNGNNEGIGQTLLSMGVGSVAGHATIDAAKHKAEDKFKDSMQAYLNQSLQVEQMAMESDVDYATRVWETQVRRAEMGWQARQANRKDGEPKLIQAGDKLYVQKIVNGQMTIEPIMQSPTQRFDRVKTALQGLGMNEKLAEATAIQAAAGDDPTLMLPTMVVGLLHSRGQTESLLKEIEGLGEQGKNLRQRYDSLGTTMLASPTADAEAVKSESQAAKDMLLLQTLQSSPGLMSKAMGLAGLPQSWQQGFDSTVRGVTPNGR